MNFQVFEFPGGTTPKSMHFALRKRLILLSYGCRNGQPKDLPGTGQGPTAWGAAAWARRLVQGPGQPKDLQGIGQGPTTLGAQVADQSIFDHDIVAAQGKQQGQQVMRARSDAWLEEEMKHWPA